MPGLCLRAIIAGLAALKRPWRCESALCLKDLLKFLWNRPLISDLFFVSSFDSTVLQQCSCCVHSQHAWEMDVSVCTQCLGARVCWIVLADQFSQSETAHLYRFLAPECFDIEVASHGLTLFSSQRRCVHAEEDGNLFLLGTVAVDLHMPMLELLRTDQSARWRGR